MEIYEILTKHLNVLQIYIWEKAFQFDVVNNIKKIFDSFDVRTQLNAHIEEKRSEITTRQLWHIWIQKETGIP